MAESNEEQEMNEAYRKRYAELQKAQEVAAQTRSMLKQICDDNAYGRLANIRAANPDLYAQLAQVLIYLAQNGQLKGKVNEELLTQLISKLLGQRRETKITRFSK
ncbi:MAG: DNA-binding protein [Candidatus Micrarchaeota archaeon]